MTNNQNTNTILPRPRASEPAICETCGAPAQLTTFDVQSAELTYQCQACFIYHRGDAHAVA